MTPELLWQAVVAGAATLVSEDLAAAGTGLAIAARKIHPFAGLVGCGAGIWLGDLGIFGIGRLAGPALSRPWVRRRVAAADLERVRHAIHASRGGLIFASRALPGTRVVTYLAAGALAMPLRWFALWSAIAVAVWTPLVVGAAWLFGDLVLGPLSTLARAGWIIALLCGVLVWRGRAWREALSWRLARWRRWEFWPSWVFYAPVAPWVAWLVLRHGLKALPGANPGIEGGGFAGESKSRILSALPDRWTLPSSLIAPGPAETRTATLLATMQSRGWSFPIILKPDRGERGAGVRLIRTVEDARAYLGRQPLPTIAQVFHPGPFEAGIFYYRRPGESRGCIFSLTDKRFPVVTGDGRSTLAELVRSHPRFRLQQRLFLERHRAQRDRVLGAGESFPLAIAGNHAQGTMFLNGASLVTAALTARLDDIAQTIDGFCIGRFDVRYSDERDLKAGRGFAIVELNGVSAEATHIYEPGAPLWQAYRTLFTQWSLVFQIGAANVRAGRPGSPVSHLVRLTIAHLRRPPRLQVAD